MEASCRGTSRRASRSLFPLLLQFKPNRSHGPTPNTTPRFQQFHKKEVCGASNINQEMLKRMNDFGKSCFFAVRNPNQTEPKTQPRDWVCGYLAALFDVQGSGLGVTSAQLTAPKRDGFKVQRDRARARRHNQSKATFVLLGPALVAAKPLIFPLISPQLRRTRRKRRLPMKPGCGRARGQRRVKRDAFTGLGNHSTCASDGKVDWG